MVTTAVDASDPARDALLVVPSDTVNLPAGCRGLYVGTTGNLVAVFPSGSVTFTAIPAGTILPVCPSRINATSTTASTIVALF